jgi:hypothetical protein
MVVVGGWAVVDVAWDVELYTYSLLQRQTGFRKKKET